MTVYEIVPATEEHLLYLAENMRESDIDEMWAANRRKPEEALRMSVSVTDEPLAGLADGSCMCMFGVGTSSLLSDDGSPWMLGHRDLPQHAIAFLRLNKVYMSEIRQKYDRLVNYVDARNRQSIRWLRWLGFTIHEARPFGADKLPFHRFELVRDNGQAADGVPVERGTDGVQGEAVRAGAARGEERVFHVGHG